MILINEDRITIETHDLDEIERLTKKGYKNFYEESAKSGTKKKARTKKRSTVGTKKKRSTS